MLSKELEPSNFFSANASKMSIFLFYLLVFLLCVLQVEALHVSPFKGGGGGAKMPRHVSRHFRATDNFTIAIYKYKDINAGCPFVNTYGIYPFIENF